jgi:hypothetical protein
MARSQTVMPKFLPENIGATEPFMRSGCCQVTKNPDFTH